MLVIDYPSWGAFLAAERFNSASNHGDSWSQGVNRIADCLELARSGWRDGRRHVETLAMPLVETSLSALIDDNRWQYAETGATYDVGEFLTGAPECWLQLAQQPTSRKLVKIAVNLTSSAGISATILAQRGAAIVALVELLQSTGHAVECHGIVGICGRADSVGDCWQRFPILSPGAVLDSDQLMFALAHAACSRRLGYQIQQLERSSGNLGWPSSRCPWADAADLWIGEAHLSQADWNNPESVAAWIRGIFDKLTSGQRVAL